MNNEKIQITSERVNITQQTAAYKTSFLVDFFFQIKEVCLGV